MTPTFKKKTKAAVDAVIPTGYNYRILSSPTGFDDMVVVRVITPAWSRLGKAERIAKLQGAVLPKLSDSERSKIFRFSVLTPKEWEGIRGGFDIASHQLLGYRMKPAR